jgi:peptide/nickel transport system substrate-binding protein
MKRILPSIVILLSFLIFSCQSNSPELDRVIIGIENDIESFNPMFSFGVNEGRISELLYLSLVKHSWDYENSELRTELMLAENMIWSEDSSSITISLLKNINWSDGKPVTTEDVVFSFDAYSHPEVNSKFFGLYDNFYLDEDNHINISKSFEIITEHKLKINFRENSTPSYLDIDMPILPKHMFEEIKYADYETADINFNPVTNGPYNLTRWNKNSLIELSLNKDSFLATNNSIGTILFKIIPDYNSQLLQLGNGEIDFIENIKPDDAQKLKRSNKDIVVKSVVGREYDYIGWNNIDIEKFEQNKIKPNIFFGNVNVRKALTHAINRNEILNEFLYDYGSLANSPVTPIFENAINKSIESYKYNPELAKLILAEEGWVDKNFDGIIEKDNTEFKFDLFIPLGNPRRDFAATVIKNNLKAVGVEVTVKSLELGQFIDNLYDRKMNAWMAAWYIPIPIELGVYWYSDFEKAPLNFQGYQNEQVDKILDQLNDDIWEERRNELLKEFQEIIHKEEPVTFLYWVDNIVAYNNRIENIDVNPLGAIHDCWEWSLAK